MTKSKKGRPGVIVSDKPLKRITTRISVEALELLEAQPNKAAFIDEAIKEKAGEGWISKISEEYSFDTKLIQKL